MEQASHTSSSLNLSAELVLSEVHVETCPPGLQRWTSRFELEFLAGDSYAETSVTVDADGDLVVSRNRHTSVIRIDHGLATPLAKVGLQIWRGACLLADYILDNPDVVKNQVVLELGAGVGLTGIIASHYAHKVFVTDSLEDALQLARENVVRNAAVVKSDVTFRCLNWLDFVGKPTSLHHIEELLLQTGGIAETLRWSTDELTQLSCTGVLLAADTVYDEFLTECFLKCALTIMQYCVLNNREPPVLLLAMEKRFNFTLRDMDSRAPAFEHFLRCINKPLEQESNVPSCTDRWCRQLHGRRINVGNVKQRLSYDRGMDMELWELHLGVP